MELRSAYNDGERIAAKYGNNGFPGGENLSPPYDWSEVPNGTKSFALAIVDLHPVAENFVHWLVIDIPMEVTALAEGASLTDKMPIGSKELLTTYRKTGYGGPRPPAGTGDHPYETTVWALSVPKLGLSEDINLDEFITKIEDKVLGNATITGLLSQ